MLTYDLDRRGTIPRYDYLCRCIRNDILCGRLTAGSRLPSRRSLAEHLKVSAVTVESAYAQLAAEGYIVSREKSGYFVSQLEPALRPPSPPPIRTDAPPPGQPWMMDLRGGGGSTELFPFSVWAKLMRQVLSQRGPDLLRPVPHSGVPELREAIAGTLYRLRGLSVSPEQIVVGSGSEYLYNLIVQLLGRELVYGVEDPGYPKPARIYALNGARCISLPVDGQGISPQTLAASPAQVVHLSPSHQFPTGAVTPAGRRQALLRWAAQGGDRYLIEDDYDSEFRFTGLPIPALQSIDQADRVIYLNTFSRALAPSLRISYLVLPPTLLDRYHQRLGFYSSTVPALEQYTLASFLSEGRFEQHLSRARNRYRALRDQVLEALEASGPAGDGARRPGADPAGPCAGHPPLLPVGVLRLPRPGAPALSGHQLPGHPDGAPAPDPEGAGCAAPLSPGRKNSLGGGKQKISLRPISINDKKRRSWRSCAFCSVPFPASSVTASAMPPFL